MTIKLNRYEELLKTAVCAFWSGRTQAASKQELSLKRDQGNRGAVTGGKNLDGFRDLIAGVVKKFAPAGTEIYQNKALVTLPGYFRPTKQWDLLVIHKGRLLAALELKSLCGPSFGNNANNRCEEALGSALDFRKAQSEGAFGKGATPFLGYFILVEDASGSASKVTAKSSHFPTDLVFQESSYQQRIRILCERMMEQQLYSSAALLTSPKKASTSGASKTLSSPSSLKLLLTRLAGHLAAESAGMD
ncbi:MAG: PaeR7I family type II restriction endonuclease [Verrucomicrobiota bacterium]